RTCTTRRLTSLGGRRVRSTLWGQRAGPASSCRCCCLPYAPPTTILRDRFSRPSTQVADDALFTKRLARNASVAPVQNKPMVRMAVVGRRDDLVQLCFNLKRRLGGGHPGAIADPKDVRIDSNGRLAKGNVEHDVCRLAADTR